MNSITPLEQVCSQLLRDDQDARLEGLRAAASHLRAAPDDAERATISERLWEVAVVLDDTPASTSSSSSSRYARKVDAAALTLLLQNHTATITASPLYWRLVHSGIRLASEVPQLRRMCVTLLKRGLAELKGREGRETVEEETRGDGHKYSSEEQWESLLVLLDALEDFPLHLMEEIWGKRLPSLIAASTSGGSASEDEEEEEDTIIFSSPVAAGHIPIPSFTKLVPFVWVSVVLDRAFTHEDALIRRTMMNKFLFVCLELEGGAGAGAGTGAGEATKQLAGGVSLVAAELSARGRIGKSVMARNKDALEAHNFVASDVSLSSSKEGVSEGPANAAFAAAAIAEAAAAAAASSDEKNASSEARQSNRVDDGPRAAGAAWTASTSSTSPSFQSPFMAGRGVICCPVWYIGDAQGIHFLKAVAESSVHLSPTDGFGRMVHDFIVAYGLSLSLAKSSARESSSSALPSKSTASLRAFVYATIAGSHVLANKRILKWYFRGLVSLSKALAEGASPSPCPLPLLRRESLVHLHQTLIYASFHQTKGTMDSVHRSCLDTLLVFCDPSTIPLPELGRVLSLFPSTQVLRCFEFSTAGSRHSAVCEWLLKLEGGSSVSIAGRLREAVSDYLSSSSSPSSTASSAAAGEGENSVTVKAPWSATALARLIVLIADGIGEKDHANNTLPIILEELREVLSCVHSHPYLSSKKVEKALLLAGALLAAAWPGGGVGDMHLARSVTGASVPLFPPHLPHPVCQEWVAVEREASAVFPGTAHSRKVTSPAGPEEMPQSIEVGEGQQTGAGGLSLSNARLGLAQLFADPGVAAELSAALTLASAQALQGGGAASFGAVVGKESKKVSVEPAFAVSLLAWLARVGGPGSYRDASSSMVGSAWATLNESGIAAASTSSMDVPRAAFAVFVLASLVPTGGGEKGETEAAVQKLLSISLRKPAGGIEDSGSSSYPWSSLLSFSQDCKWGAVCRLLREARLALPAEALDRVATDACDALQNCSEEGAASLFEVLGAVLEKLPSKADDGAAAVAGMRVEEVLPVLLGRVVTNDKLSRRSAIAYSGAVVSTSLMLRPGLHEGQGAPLLGHLNALFDRARDEAKFSHCLQLVAARLVSVWQMLVEVGDGSDSAKASTARSVFAAHLSLMLRLCHHRDATGIGEEALLKDATARTQLFRYAQAIGREGVSATPGDGEKLVPSNQEELSASQIESRLVSQGAGCLVRLQVLVWLDHLAKQCASSPTSLSLARALACSLAAANASPSPEEDTNPGSPQHCLKLRCWQALMVLACGWGKNYSNCEYDSVSDSCAVPDHQAVGKSATLLFESAVSTLREVAAAEKLCRKSKRGQPRVPIFPSSPPTVFNCPEIFFSGADSSRHTISHASVALFLLRIIFEGQLPLTQMPSLRQYLEALAVALCRRFPFMAAELVLLPALESCEMRSQQVFSLVLIASDLARHLASLVACRSAPLERIAQFRVCCLRILQALLPWTATQVGLVRILSTSALVTSFPPLLNLSFTEMESAAASSSVPPPALCSLLPPAAAEWIWPSLRAFYRATEHKIAISRSIPHFSHADPSFACTLESILCSPATEHAELVPIDAFSFFKAAFFLAVTQRHEPCIFGSDLLDVKTARAVAAGLVPEQAVRDSRLRHGFGGDGESGAFGLQQRYSSSPSSLPSSASSSYQRKINTPSFSPSLISSSSSYDSHFSELLALHPALGTPGDHAALLPLPTSRSPLLSFVDESGRAYQPLIVVSSLVNRMPNIAGLARSCEVFGAQSLVVSSLNLLKDPDFSTVAVTAAKWLPIHECPPHDLLDYVRARKAQGYSIVALEQASRSVRMGSPDCTFPEKIVLLLGAEKEGVPAELLLEADMIVEIPQLGVIRSLNVHVSASLLMWEYVRQRIEVERVREAAKT